MKGTRRLRIWRTVAALALITAIASCSSTTRDITTVPALSIDRGALDVRAGGIPALKVITPSQGATVTSPFEITIEVDNYALAAKGVSRDGEGHFHVVENACIAPGEVIGDDHTHVGSGAATVSMELEPGTHELCLQLGDGFHTALAITEMLTVNVIEPDAGG